MSENEFDDSEYIGNIWGWKFSLYSLVFILSILLLMFYLQWRSGQPLRFSNPEQAETPVDTLSSFSPYWEIDPAEGVESTRFG